MVVLEKSKCSVIMANILFQVFRENCNNFPENFDEFGREVTQKLYDQFDFLQGNPITFDNKKEKKPKNLFNRYAKCVSKTEQSVLEMTEPIELKDDDKLDLSIDHVEVKL